ncbi:hypothetical protein MLD38_018853 [Melastoma candidum]|uniref:Uncharacterized protein n=1 Tax=Melastoma candidum TaxID=119954 RepID=A0ACB9QZ47_9MYRT|nr:hypothetical protein MLD38_018853 [Melastoma candidum]
MEGRSPSSSSRPDRKTMEKKRRNQMKALISDLNAIVQRHNSSGQSSAGNGAVPVPDQIEGATRYIKKLQNRIERLKEKKQSLVMHGDLGKRGRGSMVPKVEIQRMGTSLEVTLISSSGSKLMLKETLGVLEEEGAEISNATYSSAWETILLSIHCEVGDMEFTSFTCDRISERLRQVVSLQN